MKIKILYCEDDELTSTYILKRLNRYSDNVLYAPNGKKGLELYKEHSPDLIITDLSMPELDGLDMIGAIREIDKKTPIVVTSAFSDNEKLHACIELGVNHYILKPIQTTDLVDIVIEVEDKIRLKKSALRHEKHLQQYRKAFERSSIVSVTNPNGIIKYVNDAFCDVTGFEKDELIGHQHNVLRHPNMPAMEFQKLWHTINNKEVYQGVIESRTKNGGSYITDTTIVPIVNEDEEIEEFVAIRHNLTEITDAYERNIKTIIDNDDSLIVVLNELYEPILSNKIFEETFGDIKNGFSIFEKVIFENCENEELPTDLSDKGKIIDFIFILKSTNLHQSKIKIKMEDNPDDEKIYMVKVNSITNELIRQRVYHMISFLDITEFEKMKDEQYSKSKLAYIGQLSASITHEINTPLTYIKGNLELIKMDIEELKEEEHKERILEDIQTMEGGIKRISSIIETMRETTGVSEDEAVETNIYETIIYACRMVHSKAKHITPIYINGREFNLELEKETEKFISTVFPQKLEQVWIILLNNALDELINSQKSFVDRFIKIDISEKSGKIKILFQDNAGGIPANIIDKIFESFVSTKKSNTSAGMGLGLNIAHTIITSNHGTISAFNENDGAVFKIVFE